MTQFPIPLFRRVTADRLDEALNLLVVDINAEVAVIIAAIAAGTATPITTTQLKQGLAAVDTTGVVRRNLPADFPYSAVNAGWYGPYLLPGSSLYNYVENQLGYTNAQMLAFYNSLSAYPVGG